MNLIHQPLLLVFGFYCHSLAEGVVRLESLHTIYSVLFFAAGPEWASAG
jgi:hypothetical protein